MFTGIIYSIGEIRNIREINSGREIVVYCEDFFKESNIGDSVANNGVCLTITENDSHSAHFFIQEQTLITTTMPNWQVGDKINLEHPLRLNDLLSGHLVQGHVDGVGSIRSMDKRDDDSVKVEINVPEDLRMYVAQKGSICVNGVSLTVATKTDFGCMVSLIPVTIENTNFQITNVGDSVNIEVDCIARYVEQLMNQR